MMSAAAAKMNQAADERTAAAEKRRASNKRAAAAAANSMPALPIHALSGCAQCRHQYLPGNRVDNAFTAAMSKESVMRRRMMSSSLSDTAIHVA